MDLRKSVVVAKTGLYVASSLCILWLWRSGLVSSPEPRSHIEPPTQSCCAATCIWALFQTRGQSNSFGEVITQLHAKAGWSTFSDIQAYYTMHKVTTEGVNLTSAQLCSIKPIGILHINSGHFVVVSAYTANGIVVLNPIECGAYRTEKWSLSDLNLVWDHNMLIVDHP